MAKINTQDFRHEISNAIITICEDNNWNNDNFIHRGWAFQLWCADLICQNNRNIDIAPDDAVSYSKDLGQDIFLPATEKKQLIIVQCKYKGKKDTDIDAEEVNTFFERHKHYKNKDWIDKHASENTRTLLYEYPEYLAEGFSINYYFMSNGKASDKLFEEVENINREYLNKNEPVICTLFDFTELKDFYSRVNTIEEPIPEKIELDIPTGKFFTKETPYKNLVCAIKGNSLRNLYKQYKESLFAYNIRGYLGIKNNINRKISLTANNEPAAFYYFNNGISAVCTNFEVINSNKLIAKKFQIINGAQTISSLYSSKENTDIEVLLKITETEKTATNKGINEKITEYNNSQSVIRESDFKSNDEIQKQIEQMFINAKAIDGIGKKIQYIRKRGTIKHKSGWKNIKLEDLAKIRYAYKYEPTMVLESPKTLWTDNSEGGKYEETFGYNNDITQFWTESEFEETLFMISIFYALENDLKEKQKKYPNYPGLNRFKWHYLSMFGHYKRKTLDADTNLRPFLNNKEKRNTLLSKFGKIGVGCILDQFRKYEDSNKENNNENKITMRNILRNQSTWKRMLEDMEIKITYDTD